MANIQNIQKTHTSQQQTHNTILKMGREPEQTLPTSYTDDQHIYKVMFNLTSYRRNAKQSHTQIPTYICYNGDFQ